MTSTSGTVRWNYAWDQANRLVKATSGGIIQGAYAYDGTDRRVESVESSTTTLYAYLGTETLYEQILGKANVRYVYAANLRIANVTGTAVSYYHTDALGSTRLMTDASGRAIFSNSYQPFGQDNGTPSGSGTYKFTGKPVSATTGLYYYYHRWYDPSIGRFISQDPLAGRLANPQSLNRYVYVNNIPTTFTDPTGLAMIVTLPCRSCPGILKDFLGALRYSIFGPAPVAGVTGGGLGGVGPSIVNPTPAGAIIVTAVWLYWLYANLDSIWGSGCVKPTDIPPPSSGKVPTKVPAPPDPVPRLPVVQPSQGTSVSPIDVGGGPPPGLLEHPMKIQVLPGKRFQRASQAGLVFRGVRYAHFRALGVFLWEEL